MYKMITYELRLVRDILHGGRALARHIASVLTPQLAAVKEELIENDSDQLTAAERVLLEERRKENSLRGRRNQAKTDLYELLLRVRKFLEVAVGKGAAIDLLGLEPKLGQAEALVLLRYGYEVAEELSSPDFEPGVIVVEGVVTTSQEYGEKVRAASERLEDLDSQLADQERLTEQALKVKTQALEKVHVRSRLVARILEDLYLLADEEFHAERLRRTPRRRSSSGDEDDADEADPEGNSGDEVLDDGKPEDEPPDLPRPLAAFRAEIPAVYQGLVTSEARGRSPTLAELDLAFLAVPPGAVEAPVALDESEVVLRLPFQQQLPQIQPPRHPRRRLDHQLAHLGVGDSAVGGVVEEGRRLARVQVFEIAVAEGECGDHVGLITQDERRMLAQLGFWARGRSESLRTSITPASSRCASMRISGSCELSMSAREGRRYHVARHGCPTGRCSLPHPGSHASRSTSPPIWQPMSKTRR